MKKIRKLFVKQQDVNDCGLACLTMILRYSGIKIHPLELWQKTSYNGEALSLLDLKNMASMFGLSATCVEMELDFLRDFSAPCILHLKGDAMVDHFQVCFGTQQQKGKDILYLMADPALQVHYSSEEELSARWVSRSALYFKNLSGKNGYKGDDFWKQVFRLNLFPAGLWIIFPILNLFTALLGIGVTWFLERGLNNSIAGQSQSLIAGMLLLLLIITLSKNLFTYLKERILISMNKLVSEELYTKMFEVLGKIGLDEHRPGTSFLFSRNMTDIQKIQNAISVFMATMVSDGFLIIIAISGIVYIDSWAVVFNVFYGILTLLITISNLPKLSFDQARLTHLTSGMEKQLKNNLLNGSTQVEGYRIYAHQIALKINKKTFLFESLGSMNVLITLCFCEQQFRIGAIDYGGLLITVVLTYLVTVMFHKICDALYVVTEGVEAFRQSGLSCFS